MICRLTTKNYNRLMLDPGKLHCGSISQTDRQVISGVRDERRPKLTGADACRELCP
ncbi:hypothetical protein [Dactylosporangium sp. NPDC048998]|uniref:hypothetical protein n=1 Tax=Dactylosporangium sp. NPDC048998 TaxID=3363976 RepID=UPI003713AC19